MKVLVADDDDVMRLLLVSVLESLGHESRAVANGADAWDAFQRSRPPLLVLDIEMPGLDGLEVCRRVRTADPDRETFVLVLTGRDGPDDLTAVLDSAADDYVTKPVTPEHLRARIRIAEYRIQQERARRAAEAELRRSRWLAGVGETTIALQHEINNPLSALLGHAELLRMEYAERGEQNEQVDVIFQTAQRIADVVRRLKELRDPQSVPYVGTSKMIDLSSRPKPD